MKSSRGQVTKVGRPQRRRASTGILGAAVCALLLLGRLCVVGSRQESFESQPIFSGHVDKLYSIANLEIARHDNASGAHLDIIQPEPNVQLGSNFQCEHHLYVKPAQAEITVLTRSGVAVL